jgi:aspartate-semialdehyde dehydrogenase
VELLLIILLPENGSNKKTNPEINAAELTKEDKIIANPNCSTIQMVLALSLHKKYNIKRIIVSPPIDY